MNQIIKKIIKIILLIIILILLYNYVDSIDPNVQKDVDEFFNMLMDRLETLLGKDTPTDK